jgi:hypothetical protein
MRRSIAFAPLATLLLLAGCAKPEPPDKERPPEPKAAGARNIARTCVSGRAPAPVPLAGRHVKPAFVER